jgi:hypothetical protein
VRQRLRCGTAGVFIIWIWWASRGDASQCGDAMRPNTSWRGLRSCVCRVQRVSGFTLHSASIMSEVLGTAAIYLGEVLQVPVWLPIAKLGALRRTMLVLRVGESTS